MSSPEHPPVTLIGGPARVGKTTLAYRLAEHAATELVHLDNLLHAVKAVASQAAAQCLNKAPSIDTHTPAEWLKELQARDRVLWAATAAYIAAASRPLLMEGGLWPEWVAELPTAHTAVFIVDTSDSGERLVAIAAADPDNWMAQRGWPEEKIRRWAAYNQHRSCIIADQAHHHGYPVFDIRTGIGPVQDQAIQTLLTTPEFTRNGAK